MAIKEYLKIDLKKPQLFDEDLLIYSKRESIEKQLENCFSRLESIEILNSNSKIKDSFVLSKLIIVDLAILYSEICETQQVSNLSAAIEVLKSSIQLEIEKRYQIFDIISKDEVIEEDNDLIESYLTKLLYSIEKIYLNKKKTLLKINSLNQFKQKIIVQVGFLLLFFGLIGLGFYKNYVPSLSSDYIQLYYMDDVVTHPAESNSLKQDLKLNSDWNTYSFTFEKPIQISELRIDPFNQNNLRFQIKNVRLLSNEKKVLFEREFLIEPTTLLIKDYKSIGVVNHIVPGKNEAGKTMEMLSNGNDPYFHMKIGKFENITQVELEMRVVHKKIKFKN